MKKIIVALIVGLLGTVVVASIASAEPLFTEPQAYAFHNIPEQGDLLVIASYNLPADGMVTTPTDCSSSSDWDDCSPNYVVARMTIGINQIGSSYPLPRLGPGLIGWWIPAEGLVGESGKIQVGLETTDDYVSGFALEVASSATNPIVASRLLGSQLRTILRLAIQNSHLGTGIYQFEADELVSSAHLITPEGQAFTDAIGTWVPYVIPTFFETDVEGLPAAYRESVTYLSADVAKGENVISVGDASIFDPRDIIRIIDEDGDEQVLTISSINLQNRTLVVLPALEKAYKVAGTYVVLASELDRLASLSEAPTVIGNFFEGFGVSSMAGGVALAGVFVLLAVGGVAAASESIADGMGVIGPILLVSSTMGVLHSGVLIVFALVAIAGAVTYTMSAIRQGG